MSDFVGDIVRSLIEPNEVSCATDTYAVSYRRSTSAGPETALVMRRNKTAKKETYWILIGDHREAYAAAQQRGGLRAMKRYFRDHVAQASHWSEHDDA